MFRKKNLIMKLFEEGCQKLFFQVMGKINELLIKKKYGVFENNN